MFFFFATIKSFSGRLTFLWYISTLVYLKFHLSDGGGRWWSDDIIFPTPLTPTEWMIPTESISDFSVSSLHKKITNTRWPNKLRSSSRPGNQLHGPIQKNHNKFSLITISAPDDESTAADFGNSHLYRDVRVFILWTFWWQKTFVCVFKFGRF